MGRLRVGAGSDARGQRLEVSEGCGLAPKFEMILLDGLSTIDAHRKDPIYGHFISAFPGTDGS